jgi:hypothetical protein
VQPSTPASLRISAPCRKQRLIRGKAVGSVVFPRKNWPWRCIPRTVLLCFLCCFWGNRSFLAEPQGLVSAKAGKEMVALHTQGPFSNGSLRGAACLGLSFVRG